MFSRIRKLTGQQCRALVKITSFCMKTAMIFAKDAWSNIKTGYTDMRRQINGLAGIAQAAIPEGRLSDCQDGMKLTFVAYPYADMIIIVYCEVFMSINIRPFSSGFKRMNPFGTNTAGTLRIAILCTLVGLSVAGCAGSPSSGHQEMIHDMGSQVMPFDLSKTKHIFEMNESGGIQKVVLRNQKDIDLLPTIRQHLMHEAMRFSVGDFSDPTSLHGTDMPGVKELEAGAPRIDIEYSEIPNGGQIIFKTGELSLITAIHQWFGSQLSDHGADAGYR